MHDSKIRMLGVGVDTSIATTLCGGGLQAAARCFATLCTTNHGLLIARGRKEPEGVPIDRMLERHGSHEGKHL